MKRSARFISVLVAMMLLLTTLATGVFAVDELAPASTEPAAEATEPEADAEDDATVETITEGIEDAKAADTKLSAEGSYPLTVDANAVGNTLEVTWNGSDEDAAAVDNIKAYKDGTGTPVEVQQVSTTEKEAKAKTLTLDYDTEYTVKVCNGDGVLGSVVATTAKATAPATPTGVVAYPGYKSVYVVWNASEGATKYELTRNDGHKDVKVIPVDAPATQYRDKDNKIDTTYSYKVVAVGADGKKSAPSAVVSAARVRTCYYKITFKKPVTLTSHDGTKKKHRFKSGEVVCADGFSQGKYQFDYKIGGKTYRFHAKWMRIRKPKGIISKNAYSKTKEAEKFIAEHYVNDNSTYGKSNTKWLVWINLYSQRVYLFTGSKGNWKLYTSWQCGSGKAKTPTPTGMNKTLHKKMKRYSRHKYWNCFSGTNAIHGSNGQKEVKKLGKLISNGCVRVTNSQALWMFNNVPKKTKFLVF